MFGTFRAFRRCGVVSIAVSCNCFFKRLKNASGTSSGEAVEKIKMSIEKMVFLQ